MQAQSSPSNKFGAPRNQGNVWHKQEPEETDDRRVGGYQQPDDKSGYGQEDWVEGKTQQLARRESERKFAEHFGTPSENSRDIKN